jgi:hypothetical protein
MRRRIEIPPLRLLALRATLLLVVATLLVAAVAGGLLRAGVALPLAADSAWPGRAVLGHAFLMMCGVMGTLIGIERAVAVGARIAFVAPVLSAAAGAAMLAGRPLAAAWLAVAAALAFIAVNVAVVERQREPHAGVLLAGALAWWVGNLLLALGTQAAAVVPWWFTFLVMTIAAERLEMIRLMRRRRGAAPVLHACLGAMLLGAAGFAVSARWGGVLFGLALAGLAVWLMVFDVARRTVAAPGLSRYMAVCLLLGYGWLGVAGVAWVAAAFGAPARDVALHALGIGFVFSMMLGHAPVILPALARVKLSFGWFFYVPLLGLHASLARRFFPGLGLGEGAAGNALALALFAATMAGSALIWRLQHPDPRPPHGPAARH